MKKPVFQIIENFFQIKQLKEISFSVSRSFGDAWNEGYLNDIKIKGGPGEGFLPDWLDSHPIRNALYEFAGIMTDFTQIGEDIIKLHFRLKAANNRIYFRYEEYATRLEAVDQMDTEISFSPQEKIGDHYVADILQAAVDEDFSRIEVIFSGSGDSGSIDDMTGVFLSGGAGPVDNAILRSCVHPLLDRLVDIDWWNNEGGGGTLRLFFKENLEVQVYAYQNEEVPDLMYRQFYKTA